MFSSGKPLRPDPPGLACNDKLNRLRWSKSMKRSENFILSCVKDNPCLERSRRHNKPYGWCCANLTLMRAHSSLLNLTTSRKRFPMGFYLSSTNQRYRANSRVRDRQSLTRNACQMRLVPGPPSRLEVSKAIPTTPRWDSSRLAWLSHFLTFMLPTTSLTTVVQAFSFVGLEPSCIVSVGGKLCALVFQVAQIYR